MIEKLDPEELKPLAKEVPPEDRRELVSAAIFVKINELCEAVNTLTEAIYDLQQNNVRSNKNETEIDLLLNRKQNSA